MTQSVTRIYEFDTFQLDGQKRRLLQNGQPIALAAKALDVLLVLIENRGRVVEKEELMQKVWPDSFVEEANLTVQMSALRKVLKESRNVPRYIATISGRGYRFLAEVKEVEKQTGESPTPESLLVQDNPSTNHCVAGEFETTAPPLFDRISVLGTEKSSDLIIEEHRLSRVTIEGVQQESLARQRLSFSAIRRHVVLAVLIVLFAIGVLFVIYRLVRKPIEPDSRIKSLAVLPFRPLNKEASNEILEVGMAETLSTKFSSTGCIIVRPTEAIKNYSNSEQNPIVAGRELGVDAVLDGSIQRVGDRLRITVHLTSVKTGLALWAEKYDENFNNIFSVQDSVSEQVAQALTLQLTGEQQKQLVKHPTNNPEAYQAYLQGRYFWNKRTQEGYKKAIGDFNEALQIDRNFALAYSGLADCHLFTAEQQPSKDAIGKAKEAAIKALEIDDSLAEAHTSLAKIEQFYDWNWAAAEQSFKRALALNSNYQTAHQWYAQYLIGMGREEEAFKEIHRARDLDPLSLIINTDVGGIYQDARQYDQAIAIYRKVIEMDANFARVHFDLGRALVQKGVYDEALKETQKAMELSQTTPRMLASLGYIYAVSGKAAKAQEMIERLQQTAKQAYVSPYHFALIYSGLGRKDEALKHLEQAYEERFGLLVYLRLEPRFDNLRAEPRFKDLMSRIGLSF